MYLLAKKSALQKGAVVSMHVAKGCAAVIKVELQQSLAETAVLILTFLPNVTTFPHGLFFIWFSILATDPHVFSLSLPH